jgi:hypothetical protein
MLLYVGDEIDRLIRRFFQFSIWDAPCRRYLCRWCGSTSAFNSLFEMQFFSPNRLFLPPGSPFNSLFEMRHVGKGLIYRHVGRIELSILYLRCGPGKVRGPARHVGNFQFSIWDAPHARPDSSTGCPPGFQFSIWDAVMWTLILRPMCEEKLSILYLRCYQEA